MDRRRILKVRARSGMTLIECMVALVILGGSLMALGNFMGKYAHTVSTSANEQTTLDLAANRIDSARFDSVYLDIPVDFDATQSFTYNGSVGKYKRTTSVTHVGGGPTDTLDVMYVTVTVQAPDSGSAITKTAVIPAF